MKLYRYGKAIEKLGQRYRLEGSLGNGGMADICLAWDEKNQREVAIKVLKTHQLDPDMLNRFIREGSLIKSWQHPHIIRIYDDVRMELLNPENGSSIPYLIMEYLPGGTLEDRLKTGQPYPFPQTLALFAQLCDALQYAHDHGVIHRDLKPSNILFKNLASSPDHIVLSDFGLAVSMLATHHTYSHGGTPLYMSPEQLRGQTVPASDIFALGIILYRLCTGQMPFQLIDLYKTPLPIPPPPGTIHTTLPKELDSVILTALSEYPQQRHASPQIFQQLLQEAVDIGTQARYKPPTTNLPPETTSPVATEKQILSSPDPVQTSEKPKKTIKDENIPIHPQPPLHPAPGRYAQLDIAPQKSEEKEESQKQPVTNGITTIDPAISAVPQQTPLTSLPYPNQISDPALQHNNKNNKATQIPAAGAARATPAIGATTSPTRTPQGNHLLARPTHTRGRSARWLLIPALLLIASLLACTSLALANPAIIKSIIPAHIALPGTTSPVNVSITPASQIVSNSYVITGTTDTPDPKNQTIKARNLSNTTQSSALPVTASGHQKTTGRHSTGVLTFFNSGSAQSITIARTTFHANGTAFTTNTDVVIPAFDGVNLAKASVAATADAVGTAGNIGALVINQTCCVAGVSVRNNGAFTGGVDPVDYNFVTQADVNAAATQTMQIQLAQKSANQLKSQLGAGEVLATSPQCQTKTRSSNPVGDTGQNIANTSVTVTETCSSVSYDDQGMRSLITTLLTQKAQVSPGSGYVLQNNRIIITPTIQSTDPVSLNVSAKGQWVYQFDTQQQNDLLNLIKGKSVEAARTALLNAKGVAAATIQYDGPTLPTNIGQMNFATQEPTPLAGTTSGGAGVSPTVTTDSMPLAGPGTPMIGVGKG